MLASERLLLLEVFLFLRMLQAPPAAWKPLLSGSGSGLSCEHIVTITI